MCLLWRYMRDCQKRKRRTLEFFLDDSITFLLGQLLLNPLHMLTPDTSLLYSCCLLGIGGNKRRYRSRFAMLIQSHINHLAAGNVAHLTSEQILCDDFYPDFPSVLLNSAPPG